MSVTTTGQDYLSMAIDIATTNVHNAGGPFGAVVVTADGQIFEGVNRVTANNDPIGARRSGGHPHRSRCAGDLRFERLRALQQLRTLPDVPGHLIVGPHRQGLLRCQ